MYGKKGQIWMSGVSGATRPRYKSGKSQHVHGPKLGGFISNSILIYAVAIYSDSCEGQDLTIISCFSKKKPKPLTAIPCGDRRSKARVKIFSVVEVSHKTTLA